MKPFVAAVLIAFAGAALAQSGHDHHKGEPAKKAAGQSHAATGTVKSVNAEKGTVSIDHEAVPSLKWPRMTMAFKPQDRSLLQALKPGQKVQFDFEQRGNDYVITRLR